MQVKKVVLFSKSGDKLVDTVKHEITKYLMENSVETLSASIREEIASFNPDVIVTIGGNGTVLRAAKLLTQKQIPILPLRAYGGYGGLCELGVENWRKALDNLLTGKYTLEERTRLIGEANSKTLPPTLNEYLTIKSLKALKFKVRVDGETAILTLSDGVLISTPTGSTAYALTASGLIVDPRAEAIVIALLNPWPLATKPPLRALVVPSSSTVKIESTSKFNVLADGENCVETNELKVRKHEVPVLFVRFTRSRYSLILGRHLDWLKREWEFKCLEK